MEAIFTSGYALIFGYLKGETVNAYKKSKGNHRNKQTYDVFFKTCLSEIPENLFSAQGVRDI